MVILVVFFTITSLRATYSFLPCVGLNIGGIDHRQPSSHQALCGDETQHFERVFRGDLVVYVVGNQPAAGVGRRTSVGLKCFFAKLDLPQPDGSNQNHKGEFFSNG